MQQRQVDSAYPAGRLVPLAALLAAAFAAYYFLLHETLGLLAVDEVYFAHVFWLIRQGQTIYADFYANHLPTYFLLLGPLLPGSPPDDLTFVWLLRATGLLAASAYLVMAWMLVRRDFFYLLPVLFLFLVFARMTELRPDTAGLLLFNAAWFFLLRNSGRRYILIAALLAGLSLTFSARAAVMALGMGALMAFLCATRRDGRTLAILVAIGAAFFAMVGLAYLADPAAFGRMVRLVYLEPVAVMPDVPLSARLLRIDRLLLVLLIVAALVVAALRWREERAKVVIAACATQLLLILVDPSPFQYVYGWSTLPVLAGLALAGDRSPNRLHAVLAAGGFSLAALVCAIALISATPRPGSIFRLTFDRPFAAGELARASTPRLLDMATTSERQQGLWNQLALFGEICRRVPGPVLSRFYANMICQKDALYNWTGLQWPPLFEDDPSTRSRAEFEQLFATSPPPLVAWGKQDHVPRLNPWGRALLANYDIYKGYALKRTP